MRVIEKKEVADYVIRSVLQSVERGVYGDCHSVEIIYRTNARIRPMEKACLQHHVPYVILGPVASFYQRRVTRFVSVFYSTIVGKLT
jgi:superfamily I DNA/RNA helicase